MQGIFRNGGLSPLAKIFLLGCAISLLSGLGSSEVFPNTEICAASPTITFPTDTTITKDYLMLLHCPTPVDFNSGDFVTVWVEDSEGSPIFNVSEYVEHDTGIEWVSPLSDNTGQAWDRIALEASAFDCNSTGVPYTIKVQWDSQSSEHTFDVFCPSVELVKYRQELPYWEKLRVEALVSDNRGYKMGNVPCVSKVLDIGADANASVISIKQEHELQYTDDFGRARFEYSSGLLDQLLQGFGYTVEVSCLGGDANFAFFVTPQDPDYLRNPVYYFLVYISENIVPILAAFVVALISVGVIYVIFSRSRD